MIITAISLQKKDNGRLNLFVDGIFFCSISENTLANFNLYKGKEISEEVLDDVIHKDISNRFFDRSMSLLSSRMKTQKQIHQYLKDLTFKKKGKWFKEDINTDSIIEEVVNKLLEYRYIDDSAYAKAFVENRKRSKNRSSKHIYLELLGLGVSKDIAKHATENISDQNLIKDVVYKKYKTDKIDLGNRKQVDFLLRKGFDWDDISKIGRKSNDT